MFFREGAIGVRVSWTREPGYAALNLAGLAVGLATCFYIVQFVQWELSYDEFHEHRDRIYRVVGDISPLGEIAVLHASVGAALEESVPEVQHAGRVVGLDRRSPIPAYLLGEVNYTNLATARSAMRGTEVGMQWWLQDFAFQVRLGPWVFLGGGAIGVLLVLVAAGYHALQAGLTNPAETLRYE